MEQLIPYLNDFWQPVLQIAVLWLGYYVLLVYIQDSGMLQAVKGLLFLVAMFFMAQYLRLDVIRWILSHFFQISIIGFLIIFQAELRRGLTRIGQSPLFKLFIKEQRLVDEIVKAVMMMSQKRIGALIAIERESALKSYAENGIALDGVLSEELLTTIFMPNTPFHDGGIIVQGNRVLAVSCIFPISQSTKLSKSLGTRHRAALGLSEETDALVIVVSEETGTISVMNQGRLQREISEDALRQQLAEVYQPQTGAKRRRRLLFGGNGK